MRRRDGKEDVDIRMIQRKLQLLKGNSYSRKKRRKYNRKNLSRATSRGKQCQEFPMRGASLYSLHDQLRETPLSLFMTFCDVTQFLSAS
jgi:hypothetical protein